MKWLATLTQHKAECVFLPVWLNPEVEEGYPTLPYPTLPYPVPYAALVSYRSTCRVGIAIDYFLFYGLVVASKLSPGSSFPLNLEKTRHQ